MSRRRKPGNRKNRRSPLTETPEIGACCHLFSGGPDESATRFLSAFKRDAARYGWTDAQCRGAFEDALVCEPRRWFRCGGFQDWKSVEKAFLLRWGFSPDRNGVESDAFEWSDDDESDDSVGPVTPNFVEFGSESRDDRDSSSDVSDSSNIDVGDSSSDDGLVYLEDLFSRIRPGPFVSRNHSRAEPQTSGISNLNDFISTLD